MDVSISVQSTHHEIRLELDASPEDFRKQLESAYASAEKLLWLTDTRGRQVGVPLDKLGYIEIQAESTKKVGFGSRT